MSLVIGAVAATGVLAIRATGLLQSFELAFYDWAIRQQDPPVAAADRVALVTVTEADIRALGYPIPDAVLADAIGRIAGAGARTIGLDIYRDLPVEPGHAELEGVLRGHPGIIGVTKVRSEGTAGIPPPAVLAGTERVGANDIVVDGDGIVRRALLFIDDGENTLFTFPLRLALAYLAVDGIYPEPGSPDPQHIKIGRVTFPPIEPGDGGYVRVDAAGYQVFRDYQAIPRSFPTFTLSRLLAGEVPAAELRDKVVLIGIEAESVPDLFYTPYHQVFRSSPPTPGLVLHAKFVGQLLHAALEGREPLATATDMQEALWTLLWGLLGGALALASQSPWRFPLAAAAGLLAAIGVAYAAFSRGTWLPAAMPAFAWLGGLTGVTVHISREESRQRGLIVQLFSPYVGPQIVEQLIRDPEQARRGSRQCREVTLLFCDIVGFVKFCEAHTVDEIVAQVNEYLEAMSEVVFHWGGTLIDFRGDEVYALWGAPLEQPDHVERAVRCALHIRERLAELNRRWAAQGRWQLDNGVGLHTGEVVFANMGAEGKRMKFQAVGDAVNLASRVEGLTRKLGRPILLTDETAMRLKPLLDAHAGQAPRPLAHVALRKLAAVRVAGRQEPVVVWSLATLEAGRPSVVEEPETLQLFTMTEK